MWPPGEKNSKYLDVRCNEISVQWHVQAFDQNLTWKWINSQGHLEVVTYRSCPLVLWHPLWCRLSDS